MYLASQMEEHFQPAWIRPGYEVLVLFDLMYRIWQKHSLKL